MNKNINQIAHHAKTIKEFGNWAEEALHFIASEADKAKNILANSNYE